MNKKSTACYWIENLQLSEHPEGGYYRETYRSDMTVDLLMGFNGSRSISSAIYFLLDGHQFSALHRIKSDEIWHFYTGSPIILYVLENKKVMTIMLGNDLEKGERFQSIVKAGSWFEAIVSDCSSYSLMGCTLSPGFDFRDFELGERNKLIQMYPEHKAIIEKLTKNTGS
jgi:predicted cupin superfamily sugar epimerase